MASCPNGHTSQASDYCDVCGERIEPSSPASASGASASGGGASGPLGTQGLPTSPGGGRGQGGGPTPCPDCGTPGSDRFCEACGYDFATGGGKPTPRTAPATPSQPAP
ncbi:phosphopeptide-binding protein, partial [Actinomadura sp. KC216]